MKSVIISKKLDVTKTKTDPLATEHHSYIPYIGPIPQTPKRISTLHMDWYSLWEPRVKHPLSWAKKPHNSLKYKNKSILFVLWVLSHSEGIAHTRMGLSVYSKKNKPTELYFLVYGKCGNI